MELLSINIQDLNCCTQICYPGTSKRAEYTVFTSDNGHRQSQAVTGGGKNKTSESYHQCLVHESENQTSLLYSLAFSAVYFSRLSLLHNSCLCWYHWSWWIILLLVIYRSLFTTYYNATSCEKHTRRYMIAHQIIGCLTYKTKTKAINYKSDLNGWSKVNICTSQYTKMCIRCLFFICFVSQLDFKLIIMW